MKGAVVMMVGTNHWRFVKRLTRIVSLIVAMVVLNGCATMYNDTVDFFTGEDSGAPQAEAPMVAPAQPQQDPDKPFPTLSSGLAPDLQGRRYSSAPIQRQGAPTQTLETELAAAQTTPPPPPPVATPDKPPVAPVANVEPPNGALAPAPPPTPKPPVASSPIGGETPPAPPIPAPYSTVPAMKPAYMTPGLADFSPAPQGVGVRETFMARLSQRLPLPSETAAAEAAPAGAGSFKLKPLANLSTSSPSMPLAGGFYDSPETVVISSSGVTQGASASSYAQFGSTQAPQFNIDSSGDLSGSGLAIPAMGLPMAPGAIKVATILFRNGSSKMTGMDKSVIRKVMDIYRQQGGRIRVVGHSSSRTRNMDQVKHKMVNYRLSADRADTVAALLINLGVPSTDIIVDAKSDAMPIYYETMPTGEAGNRRAEIFFE